MKSEASLRVYLGDVCLQGRRAKLVIVVVVIVSASLQKTFGTALARWPQSIVDIWRRASDHGVTVDGLTRAWAIGKWLKMKKRGTSHLQLVYQERFERTTYIRYLILCGERGWRNVCNGSFIFQILYLTYYRSESLSAEEFWSVMDFKHEIIDGNIDNAMGIY